MEAYSKNINSNWRDSETEPLRSEEKSVTCLTPLNKLFRE